MDLLQAHIDRLNAEARERGSCCELADADHFRGYGIETPQELDDYMDLATYSDWYKDRYGFRPRSVTVEEARRQMELWTAQDAEERETTEWVYTPDPAPKNNQLAIALKRAGVN